MRSQVMITKRVQWCTTRRLAWICTARRLSLLVPSRTCGRPQWNAAIQAKQRAPSSTEQHRTAPVFAEQLQMSSGSELVAPLLSHRSLWKHHAIAFSKDLHPISSTNRTQHLTAFGKFGAWNLAFQQLHCWFVPRAGVALREQVIGNLSARCPFLWESETWGRESPAKSAKLMNPWKIWPYLTLPCIQPRVLPGCRLASIASEQELDTWTAQISPQNSA